MAIKTILLMAQTLDGKIAKYADHFPDWTGKADKQLFVRETRQAGAIIMGSKTYDTIGKPLPGRRNIVMTRNAKRVSQWENLVYTSLAPRAILENLEKDGYQRVVLAGGARINTLFAEAGLIDEVLDVLGQRVVDAVRAPERSNERNAGRTRHRLLPSRS